MRQRQFVLVCLALILLLGGFSYQRARMEANYQGKTAAQWFEAAVRSEVRADEYAVALNELRSNFVPVFLSVLAPQDSPVEKFYRRMAQHLPAALKSRLLSPTYTVMHMDMAWEGLGTLGKGATDRDKLVSLVVVANGSKPAIQEMLMSAKCCLAIGKRGFAQHTAQLLQDEDFTVRFYAAYNYATPSIVGDAANQPLLTNCIRIYSEAVTNEVITKKCFGRQARHWRTVAYQRLGKISPDTAARYAAYAR